MTQEPQKNNNVLISIAIIGVIGTVIAAALGVIGNFSTEKLRQDAELTRIAVVSTNVAQENGTPILVTITLSNNNCRALDYYVDGKLMVSSIQQYAKVPFNLIPGEHQVLVCTASTNTCNTPSQKNWTTSTTVTIPSADDCPITIMLINNNCRALDYYVDEKLMVSSIEPHAKVPFNLTSGEHQVLVCNAGTNACNPTSQKNWTVSTAVTIPTAPDCPQ